MTEQLFEIKCVLHKKYQLPHYDPVLFYKSGMNIKEPVTQAVWGSGDREI